MTDWSTTMTPAPAHQLTPDDLAFFTNGSMVQRRRGATTTRSRLLTRQSDLGLFDVWKKLAARDRVWRREPVHLRH